MDSSYRRDSISHKTSIFDVLLCGCCAKSSSATEILLEESGMDNMERKQFTVMFGQCKSIGIKVVCRRSYLLLAACRLTRNEAHSVSICLMYSNQESTISGPKVVKVSQQRWNRLREGDKILSVNHENCVDSSVEVVQFLLMNLYEKSEAVFEIERENQTMKVGVGREDGGFGFDFIKSTQNSNYIEVNSIHSDQSNDIRRGDKILSINDIDGGMINTDDLQSMLVCTEWICF